MIKINLLPGERLAEVKRERRTEADKAYREANKERLAEYKRQHYVANRERILARVAEYREDNKERIAESKHRRREAIREYQRQYYHANKERPTKYYVSNKERILAQKAQFRRDNPERAAEVSSRQTAKKHGYAPLKFQPGETIAGLIAQQNGMCPVCHKPLGGQTHIDHCHETGRVRAITHPLCNVGIGCFDESPEALRKAADYIEAHRARISGQP